MTGRAKRRAAGSRDLTYTWISGEPFSSRSSISAPTTSPSTGDSHGELSISSPVGTTVTVFPDAVFGLLT